jgi:hypothetical protein
MKAERKVNIIRALKSEIDFYKQRPVPVKMFNMRDLKHLKLCTYFSMQEVAQTPKDILSLLLIHKMAEAFEGAIIDLPIETEYDKQFDGYKATLDLWVKS